MSDNKNKIPSGKAQRAGRFFKTGMKVSGNYLKHYSKKALKQEVNRSDLDRKNADDIFKMLTKLKGTALKIAQMLSLDNGLLPKEYTDKFKEAQYKNEALSGPLIINTFQKYTGHSPYELFDKFNPNSLLAASIGQVHEAWKDGVRLAVKVQYPGVADSIHSDINMVKPVFLRAFNIKSEVIDEYLVEVVDKLVEETDYETELANGVSLSEQCAGLDYVTFPKYFPDWSGKKVLTMEWLEGVALTDYIQSDAPQPEKDKVGQMLLDFIHFQVHHLKRFHADMHPGNFFVMPDGKLGVLDFGCVKKLPESFYHDYFSMIKAGLAGDDVLLRSYLLKLDFMRESDTPELEKMYYDASSRTIGILAKPLGSDTFYFGSKEYFKGLTDFGLEMKDNKEFRKPHAFRGPKDAIYLHRAYFGLYNVLHELNATVKMDRTFFSKLDQ
ncbi:MAG: AarF/ABC1/UbiB kinase family protein [Bacteroidetes bacterium]|nr:AarF/ABC1/UbiB kinase family protein [Bacteroidota bacterium]